MVYVIETWRGVRKTTIRRNKAIKIYKKYKNSNKNAQRKLPYPAVVIYKR